MCIVIPTNIYIVIVYVRTLCSEGGKHIMNIYATFDWCVHVCCFYMFGAYCIRIHLHMCSYVCGDMCTRREQGRTKLCAQEEE